MPSGRFQHCHPTLFEVHLGRSWSLFMCYLLPRTVTERTCSRSLRLFFQDFLWLEAVGCAFCHWLRHRAEGSACPPSDSCLANTKELLAVKVPWALKNCARDGMLLLLPLPVGRQCDVMSRKNKDSSPRDASWNVTFFVELQCPLDLSLLICKMAMKRLTCTPLPGLLVKD